MDQPGRCFRPGNLDNAAASTLAHASGGGWRRGSNWRSGNWLENSHVGMILVPESKPARGAGGDPFPGSAGHPLPRAGAGQSVWCCAG